MLDYMVVLFFKEIPYCSLIVAIPVYIPTNSIGDCPFLHTHSPCRSSPVVEEVGDDGGEEAEQQQGRAGVHDGVQPCPPNPHPVPPAPPLTYASVLDTCLGTGLFPAQMRRVFPFLPRRASSFQPQPQGGLP